MSYIILASKVTGPKDVTTYMLLRAIIRSFGTATTKGEIRIRRRQKMTSSTDINKILPATFS